jgi:hypothetical protein
LEFDEFRTIFASETINFIKMNKKTKSLNSISTLLIAIGFSLCVGSIAAFIAMNIIAPENGADLDFIHWQRHFINPIMAYVTVPGIWLFLAGNAGLFFVQPRKNLFGIIQLILAVLVFANGLFLIVPTAKIASGLAAEPTGLSGNIELFLQKKTMEDSLGGVNLVLLIAYLIVTTIQNYKNHDKRNKHQTV